MDLHLRHMEAGDLADAMRLKELAGWNQTEDDWRLFLGSEPEGCFVAQVGSRVVATAATMRCGPRLAWIGMVLVDPDFRCRGIGTRLAEIVVDRLRGHPTVGLDATPAGRKIYERLGFKEEYGVLRMRAERAPEIAQPPGPLQPLQPLGVGDLEAIASLDRQAFGGDRQPVLEDFLRRAPESAWQLVPAGRVSGFCLGRPGAHSHQIGPLVAQADEDAVLLAGAALSRLECGPVVMDVPEARTGLREWLGRRGFVVERAFARMYLGEAALRAASRAAQGMQFAVAGPEFG